jgi:hypothetical protein
MEWDRENFFRRLFAVLRIGDVDPTTATDDQVIESARKRAKLIYEGEVDGVVEQQIVEGKIRVDEKAFARKMVLEMGMPVFVAFCRHRQTMTAASGHAGRVAISDVQQRINDQLGLSAEVFAKHNNGRH